MEYRKLPHGGESISILGLGASSIQESSEKEIEETISYVVEQGINYFDMASAEAKPFPAYGRAFSGVRDKVYFQIHFGANYASGTYGWTTDPDTIKKSVDWQLSSLKTDYIDFWFIHCIDELSDLQKMEKNGVIKAILQLKEQGIVHHVGLSSHTPDLAGKVLDMGILDMMMFSINPAYDYQKGEYGIGTVDDRMALYQRCEREGVGISVMKAFAAGQLLDEKTSPFRKALTEYQCIQYALDKPGVITVLPGVRGKKDLERILGFCKASKEEKDYSIIASFAPQDAEGTCVYCNHCAPCPAGLNIGLINKYYDLARVGDQLAADHYQNLEVKAESCIQCGHCNRRCPFHVDQVSRMKEISEWFK